MTIQILATIQRPNLDVPWTPFGNDYQWYMSNQYFLETWHEKGRLLSITNTHSDDDLTVNTVIQFSDWEALDDYISDTTLNTEIRTPRQNYFATAGIEITNLETIEV